MNRPLKVLFIGYAEFSGHLLDRVAQHPDAEICGVMNIVEYLRRKIEFMGLYSGEMGTFPFPRSADAIESLARTRGASSGFEAAEALEHVRERQP